MKLSYKVLRGIEKGDISPDGTVAIPQSVRAIGDWAFSRCEELHSITISENIRSIGDSAFRNCQNLEHVSMSNSIIMIGENAFCGCKSLKTFIVPDRVTSIEGFTFCGCENLRTITIPSSVTSIKDSAFLDCNNLERIIVDNESELSRVKELLPDHLKPLCRTKHQVEIYNEIVMAVVTNQNAKFRTHYKQPTNLVEIRAYILSFLPSFHMKADRLLKELGGVPSNVCKDTINEFRTTATRYMLRFMPEKKAQELLQQVADVELSPRRCPF